MASAMPFLLGTRRTRCSLMKTFAGGAAAGNTRSFDFVRLRLTSLGMTGVLWGWLIPLAWMVAEKVHRSFARSG